MKNTNYSPQTASEEDIIESVRNHVSVLNKCNKSLKKLLQTNNDIHNNTKLDEFLNRLPKTKEEKKNIKDIQENIQKFDNKMQLLRAILASDENLLDKQSWQLQTLNNPSTIEKDKTSTTNIEQELEKFKEGVEDVRMRLESDENNPNNLL